MNSNERPVGARSVLQIGRNLLMPIGQSLHCFVAIPLGPLKNPQLPKLYVKGPFARSNA
jgi:hypothetical protein